MQAQLEKLLVLQDRDQKIRQIQFEIGTFPQQRQSLDRQVTASAASLEALKGQGRQLEVERKNLELDVGTRQASINRLKTQQYETRKNDEFQAMGHEIERYEKEIVKLEDQELELMDQAEKLKGRLTIEEKTAAAARDSVQRQLTDLEQKEKTLQTRLDELTRERAELAAGVEEDILDRYQRLFGSKGDAVVVAVQHGVCTGCHMKVTTQTAVRARSESEIVSCEQCGRILYAAD
ncbi:MAG: C4-type zinc ribbon domain-containing protein [Verrucomicrobiota bacterium]